MTPSSSPLDRPASILILRRLLVTQALTPEEVRAMESRIRQGLPWGLCLDRGLLTLGIALIVSGIGYFFAHNWNHLTDDDKLGLAAGSVLLSLLGATWAGFDRFPGKLLLLAASMLVGIYLGVFSQVYQTGQDGFEAFTTWSLLILPWVILGRFVPLWLFWIVLLNGVLGFYWTTSPFINFSDDYDMFRHISIGVTLLNLAALTIREGLSRAKISWLDQGWAVLILLIASVLAAASETITEILHTWDYQAHATPGFIAFGLFALYTVALGFYYCKIRYSLPALAILTLSACTVLTAVTVRLFGDSIHFDHAGIWFLMGVIVLAIFGGGVFFLRTQRALHHR